MKILIHSNGNPFNLGGGYNEQIRYLFKIFYEAGHDVYFLNSGLSKNKSLTEMVLITSKNHNNKTLKKLIQKI